jgi:hypothetical protein
VGFLAISIATCPIGCRSQAAAQAAATDESPTEGPPDVKPESPNVVSLNPQDWYILYSAQMPSHPSSDSEGAWSFEFPSSQDGGHVNYVQTPFNATGTPSSISMTFDIESNAPQYGVVDPTDTLPATTRLFFEQQETDLTNPNGRWWADASIYNLGSQDDQTLTFTVPLTPDQWSNVVGQQDAQALAAAIANIGWVGMTFGGQSFAGHGVAISSGTAKYILVSYTVN